MKNLLFVLRILSAAAVLVMIGYCCFQCIDIYISGSQAAALPGTPIFSMPDVLQRLQNGKALFVVCICVIAVTALLHRISGTAAHAAQHTTLYRPGHEIPARRLAMLRCTLLVAALLFVVLGVMNGGLYDVLVKAINICTECIGLG